MTSEVKKSGLPTWAKILIGLVVVVFVIGIVSIVAMIFFVQNVMKQAQDPVAIQRTAKAIADFPEPLPNGYKFAFALGMAGINTVTIEHKSDQQMLIMISYPKSEDTDPKALVQKVFEGGIKAPGQSKLEDSKFQEVKSQGLEDVAGESMPYMIGSMTDKEGTKYEGMVGCVVSKAKKKTIFLYGMQPGAKGYNLKTTEDFLKTIKSF